MAADAQTILDNINAIYTSELGRSSDPEGAAFYSNLARSGTSLEGIRAQIAGSAEGQKYTSQNEAALNSIYQSELGRAADAGGMTYYTNMLNQGVSPNEIRRQINLSDEGRKFDQTTAANIMASQLGRVDPFADTEGLNFYTNLLQQGTPIENIVGQINRSPEGKAYDLQTLKSSYQTLFNRGLDAEGEQYWLNRMQEDPNINKGTLMDFLKAGAKGADVPGAGTKTNVTSAGSTTTTNVVPSNTVQTQRFDVNQANQVIPQTIGPGGGSIEAQIREGVIPQQVVIGGAPVNISGGYGAYPYGIESLAQNLGTPAAKLRNMAANPASMTSVYAPVMSTSVGGTNVPGINYQTTPFSSMAAPTMATPSRAVDIYTNPYAGPYTPAPYQSPYGPVTGAGGVTVTVPPAITGAVSAPATTAATVASPNVNSMVG